MWGKVRIGIIGCGGIAGYHIQGYFNNPDVSLVAFCDVREENVSSQVSEFGGRGYPDYRSMLEKEKLDGVSICTPPSSHQQIAIESMKRGVNVFCEKPLASTVNEAVSMASIDLSWSIPIPSEFCAEVYGTEGSIMLGGEFRYHLRNGKGWVEMETGKTQLPAFSREVNHFVKCIRGEEKPIVSGLDGLRAMEVIEAAYKSVEEKVWVDLTKLGGESR